MAMPNLMDPNFNDTVTCMCEHTADGAVGIVINRVHPSLFARDIFEELGIEFAPSVSSIPVHLGGPVHLGEIFILHGPPFEWEACHRITPDLAMSNTRDILEAIARGRGPESLLIAVGCAGWGPAQLESELKANVWLTSPAVNEIIFELAIDERWEASVRKIGFDPSMLMDIGGNA